MVKPARELTSSEKLQDELAEEDARSWGSGRRGKAGGKLNRTETVTVRLDPKLNYLCELAARSQRRTKSSFIEWAIENALTSVSIPGERTGAGAEYTIAQRSSYLWDVDDPDRLVALVHYAPSLLTHEEQVFWKIVTTSPFLWPGHWEEGLNEEVWDFDPTYPPRVNIDRLREHWDAIRRVAEGSEPRSQHGVLVTRLIKGQTISSKPFSADGPLASEFENLDDVPF